MKTDFQNRGKDLGGIIWEEDPIRHRDIAKTISPAFSPRAIRAMEDTVQKYIDIFLGKMREIGSAETNSTTAITLGTTLSISDSLTFIYEHGYKIATRNNARPATSGSWALNGGYSNLATIYGLGADNLVQVSIIIPDSQLRIIN